MESPHKLTYEITTCVRADQVLILYWYLHQAFYSFRLQPAFPHFYSRCQCCIVM